MRTVIIESPYAGAIEANRAYLWRCIRDSLAQGEAPFASHGLYPGPLNEGLSSDRLLGIMAGFAWWPGADEIIFYLDLGWSRGMRAALGKARGEAKRHSFRLLDGGPAEMEARLGELTVPLMSSERSPA